MRARAMALILPGLLLGPVAGGLVGQSTTGSLTGRVIVRERENKDHSLLVSLKSPTDGIRYMRFQLPAKIDLAPGFLPQGWSFKQDGKTVEAEGTPLRDLNLRFDAPANSKLIDKCAGKNFWMGVRYTIDGPVQELTTAVQQWPRVTRLDTIDDALTLPPDVPDGQPFFGVPKPGYTEGTWQTAGERENLWTGLNQYDRPSHDLESKLNAQLVPGVGSSAGITFTYTDPWGEETVHGLKLLGHYADYDAQCPAGVTGGSPLTFAGQDACVTGCFPQLPDAFHFSLDGKTPLIPQAASRTTVVLKVPPDITAGSHEIVFGDAQGYVTVGILQLQGSIDQNQLWKGQSTTMRLEIIGSDKSLPLLVLNRTPGVIDIQGGVRQTIPTPGGAANAVSRSVRGIHRGDFQIDYSLDLPPCGFGTAGKQ